MNRHLHPKISLLTATALLYVIGTHRTIAQPITAANDGTGTQINQQGQQFQIQGGTRSIDGVNLFHSFQRFGLNPGQVANFLSTPGTQNILGRIIGGNASVINGQIQVSGGLSNLYLLNPAGIVFGANASLNVPGSFTATTANGIQLSDQWWGVATHAAQMRSLTGNPTGFGFNGSVSGNIFNAGELQVNPGRGITLLGGQVINTGTIAALGGNITIAAVPGEQFVRISQGNNLLNLELPTRDQPSIDQPATADLAELLTGNDLGDTGINIANGQMTIAATSTPIPNQSGNTIVSGKVSTTSTPQAGNIDIFGQQVGIVNADISANSNGGGGKIRIGGDYQGQGNAPRAIATTVDGQSRITADAQRTGNGGQVIVWADQTARVQGAISAHGGTESGNGGLVETSGKAYLDVAGAQVGSSAPNGQPGTWLLDPTDIEIVGGGTGSFNPPGSGLFDPPLTGVASQIDPVLIEATLDAGTNVTLTTASGGGGNGDFRILSSVNQTGTSSASFTINARRFGVQNGSTINLNSTGALTLNVNAIDPEANVPTSSVQAAIDMIGNTNGARVINLNDGTYAGNTLSLNQNLTLNGASSSQTFLSGENVRSVVNVAPGVTATISNLTIQNGLTNIGVEGGGLTNNGNLTLDRVTVQQNQSGANGGGIFNAANSNLALNTSIIQNNNASSGGGIFNAGNIGGNASSISSNSATDGGGILNAPGGTISNFVNSTVASNTAANSGGGIFNSGTIQSQQLLIDANTATNGGGILNATGGSLDLNDATVSNNTASANGGGIANTGQATIVQLDINTNQATGNGGGIWNSGNGQVNLNDAQVINNQATFGGGIYSEQTSNLQIQTAAINRNQAQRGGGLYLDVNSTATLTQAGIEGNTSQSFGGGIASFATLNLSQVSVNNNIANTDGGGIFSNGNLTLNQMGLSGNRANNSGGGIFNLNQLQGSELAISSNQAQLGGGLFNSGIATIDQTTFTQNNASIDGGGIRVGFPSTPSRLTLTNSTLQGNTAAFGGGLEASEGSIVTVQNTQFLANQASDRGGAIQNDDFAQMMIDQSTIDGNSAPNGAGGIFNYGDLSVTNTTISNNQTSGSGGGVFSDIKPGIPLSSGTTNLSNVTISGNQANEGGGVQSNQGNTTIASTTIANNTATNQAGGINQNGATIVVGNTIIATNTAPNASDVSGQFTDQGNNLIGNNDGSNGFTNSTLIGSSTAPIDPLLAPLGNYGGITQTQTLLPGSPALDTGNSSTAPANDQRGVGRIGNADIGAIESQGFTVTAITGTPQNTLINTPFPQPLTVSVTSNGGEPVDGGQITFTPPASGASTAAANATTVTVTGGQATIPVSANAEAGSYQVTASSAGIATPETFDLANTLEPLVAPPLPPAVSPPTPLPSTPTGTPTTPTGTTTSSSSTNSPARFAQNNCDVQSIGGRLNQEFQDWQLRVGDRAEIRRLLDAGEINAALQAIDIAQAQRQNQAAYLQPNVMPLGCPAAKLNELTAETRPAMIYTFAQAGHLDIILITPGQTPQLERITEANQTALKQVIATAKQGNAEANQLLYSWLIQPFEAELKTQSIETLVFSLDRDLAGIHLGKLQNNGRSLSQQYQIRQILN